MRFRLRRPRLISSKRFFPHTRHRKLWIRLTAFVLVIAAIFLAFAVQLMWVIRASAPTVLNASVTKLINDTVMNTLSEKNIQYSELVTVHYDSDGHIVSLTYNNVAANTLRSEISTDINTVVSNDEVRYMRVPWSTLNGFEFLQGFGKGLRLDITQYGYVLTNIHSEFTSAGINQTRHSLILDVTVKVQGYISVLYVSSEVKTSMIVAETVIVGTVPDAYFNRTENNG